MGILRYWQFSVDKERIGGGNWGKRVNTIVEQILGVLA